MKCAMSYFWYDSVNNSIWFLLESFRGIKAPSLTPSQKQIATLFCQKDSELELIFKYVFPTLEKQNLGFQFQRCDISATHALHSKQLQRDAARDNRTRPRAKAFAHIKMLLTASKLGASRSGSLLARSSKSHSFSHTMKQSDSFQIQGEYVTSVGPHNGRGKRGGPGKIKSTAGGHAPPKGSFPLSGCKGLEYENRAAKRSISVLFNGLFPPLSIAHRTHV